ncbi:carboxylating nicotinate-nucleotide diphosphorylase [Actinomadura madurae]|uniref:carboxylating nicotinate-nucleotide diphosphorylase n=1 Tax=Actinomadura madurae TaxID=1993 RepID=UPI0020D23CDD|nr:carboxylating nicotinate-nucleotide diphosphorylase [Actinomadura madurae]MCP9952775.1 carboxylating nicotinate-nucleotide diphosphorylase [Actinomadura madurae]MCP9969540.1 carboxylating nicotinate-nucleotide diphosphorylase [Actinomadura madurae]MCP9981995.1 carboxylating nicotinate-nucleotide diphosphorylase [Actinomadura madurae]MCQ0006477.1 carboxylating nicotinate-nucleotide diphosphorylase [Actinomadura madurae]MCQ0018232.1 carboxylating nicotinate-nucleotide diphosphorylase [Actinom
MTPELSQALSAAGLDPQDVDNLVRTALAEDGEVDVTSMPIFAPEDTAAGDLRARQDGVVAGVPVACAVFEALDVAYEAKVEDGDRVVPGQVLISVSGTTRALLRAERTALNLLTHLSGIATATRQWADAMEGTKARVRDTRKTLPGLRALQKYAVRCGGGVNHRMALHDAALIKDNHVAAAGSVTKAYEAIRAVYPSLHVQVECDTLAQVEEALAVGASSILLDNMTDAEMAEAVRLGAGRAEFEASGGLTLERARDVAVTGVDYLAVGALTHSAHVFDIGLDFS